MGLTDLIVKYSGPGPRYTSYPTAPQWTEAVGAGEYRAALDRASAEPGPVALYVHLPFCEKLCYYCGCNIQITHDRSRSGSYVSAVQKEIGRLAEILGRRPISQMSWGGGTPTFLSLTEIESLFHSVADHFEMLPDSEVSIEIDPRVTTADQLRLLRRLGFNRVSMGVQDFNPEVQRAVNRVQPAEDTAKMLAECQDLGFKGINFDLIYGLPFQTPETFSSTIDQLLVMRPDRIAMYNYARLPSLLKHQQILEKFPMPSAEARVEIFTQAFGKLIEAGYVAIGMDHFALKTDALSLALSNGNLYRNFMGYTVQQAKNLLGVGASSIGEVGGGFFQNVKKASEYEAQVEAAGLATAKGLVLSEDDLQRKWVIQHLLCQFHLNPQDFERQFGVGFATRFERELSTLTGLEEDGIVRFNDGGLHITELGRLFVRNVAMVFDAYLGGQKTQFSQTV